MGAYQDTKHIALRSLSGGTGNVRDMEAAWLKAATSSSGATQDLWHQYLDDLNIPGGQFQDRVRVYFTMIGIPVSDMNEMWKQFWLQFYPLVVTGDIRGDTGRDMHGAKTNVYTRASSLTRPSYSGDETGMFTLGQHEASLLPRLQRNLITASEDMTNGAYSVTNSAVVDSATQVTFDGTANGGVDQSITIVDNGSGAGGRTFVFSCEIALVSGTVSSDAALDINIAGTAFAFTTQAIGSAVSATPQRFSITASTDAAGTTLIPRVRWDDAGTLEITKWQVEEVTGLTDQNPSGYAARDTPTGPELVTNTGDLNAGFSSITDWAANANGYDELALVGSNLELTVTGATSRNCYISPTGLPSITIGNRYVAHIKFGTTNTGGSAIHLNNGSSSVSNIGTDLDDEEHIIAFTAISSGAIRIKSYFNETASRKIELAYFSVREATTGLYESNNANGNTVSGGVVTEALGLELHPYEDTVVNVYGHNYTLNLPARYEHFPLSTVLDTNTDSDRTISTLANATYPNGSQGIFNEVEAYPNLLPPAARTVNETDWTKTGTGTTTNNGDGSVTLSDEDDDAAEVRWDNIMDIPTDNETYKATIDLGEGTAEQFVLAIQFSGTSTDINILRYDWSDNTATLINDDSGNSVVDAQMNGDGTVRLSITSTDIAANDTLTIHMHPGDHTVGEAVGTGLIHGDVVLNRISAAAEPEWNPDRPNHSKIQRLLQQHDLNTTWSKVGTPTAVSDQTGIRGGANVAQTIEDNNASGFEAFKQFGTLVSGESACVGVAIKKVGSVTAYPGIRFNGFGNYEIVCDPVLGQVQSVGSAGNFDRFGCIDGAVLEALLPNIYSNGSDFWIFWASRDNNTDTSSVFQIWPAHFTTPAGTVSSSNVGSVVVDEPFMHEGKYPFFFDDIAEASEVTETIADFSKTFTYLTEGTNNAVNAVFSHGHYLHHGMPNSTALTNTVTTPAHVASAEADWSLSSSVTSQANAISVFPGEVANRVTGNGSSPGALYQQDAAALTSSAETVAILIEGGTSDPDDTDINLKDDTAGGAINYAVFTWATGTIASTGNPQGTAPKQWAKQLGIGPNGGALWELFVQGVPSNAGNTRDVRILPNGGSADHSSGDNIIIHYIGHVESDVVSLCPIIDGTTRVAETWVYDGDNLPDANGVLLADLVSNLDRADMSLSATSNIIGTSKILHLTSSEYLKSYDGTNGATSATAQIALDSTRAIVRWAGVEQALRIAVDGAEAEVTGTYDGSWSMSDVEIFEDGDYEFWLQSLVIAPPAITATQSSTLAGYD